MNAIKHLLTQLSAYSLLGLLGRLTPFILLPVFTTYLSPTDFGKISLINTLSAILGPFILLGIPTFINVVFFKKNKSELLVTIRSTLWVPLTITLASTIFLLTIYDIFWQTFSISLYWLLTVPLIALLTFTPRLCANLYRSLGSIKKYSILELCQILLGAGSAVFFIVYLGMGWEGRVISILVCGTAVTLGGLLWLSSYGVFNAAPDIQQTKTAAKFGANLIPHELGSQFIRNSDKIFLVPLTGYAQTGNYSVALQVSSALLMVLTTFNLAWQPYLFSQIAKRNFSKVLIVRLSIIFVIAFGVLALIFPYISTQIYATMIDERYVTGLSFIPIFSLSYFFLAINLIFVDYIYFMKKTALLAKITVFSAILNIVANLVLIQKFGAMGAAYAFCISSFVSALLTAFFANRFFPMPWSSVFSKDNVY